MEAGQAVLQADRQADQVQGDLAAPSPTTAPPQGALSITGLPALKAPFEPLVPGAHQGAEHQLLPRRGARHGDDRARRSAAGPPTRSSSRSCSRARRRSPPSSSSRCRTPAAASRRRPATSSGSARSATSTTCCSSPTRSSAPSAGSGTMFGAEQVRLPARHHHLRQGPDLRLLPARRVHHLRPADRAVLARATTRSCTATPSAATRSRPRSRWPTSTSSSARTSTEHVLRQRGRLPRRPSSSSTTCRSSATSAATATSTASSWSRTRPPRRPSTTRSRERLLRGFLSKALFDAGLYCRADDRGDPVVQLAPPLICDQARLRRDRADPALGAHRGVGAAVATSRATSSDW